MDTLLTQNDIAWIILSSPMIYITWLMFKPLSKKEIERQNFINEYNEIERQKILNHKFSWEK